MVRWNKNSLYFIFISLCSAFKIYCTVPAVRKFKIELKNVIVRNLKSSFIQFSQVGKKLPLSLGAFD